MQKHVVYVPEHLVDPARSIALDIAGGATLSPGHEGYWVAPDGELHIDRITLVTVFEDGTKARDHIVQHLMLGGEQSVAYETNGVPALVAAPRGA